ncbi:MAG: hypothetical protein IJ438_09645 [Clostridia bacterium]|nr:hypothetical protein [Clostridia bacterium]
MLFDTLLERWCALADGARIVLVTDDGQHDIACRVARQTEHPCTVCLYDASDALRSALMALKPCDLVLVLQGFDSYLSMPRWFSAMGKPAWLAAKCAFIRLGIRHDSLVEGLATPKEAVYAKISERGALPPEKLLRITNAAGTELTLRTGPFATCAHEITADGGFCFLPPSETSSEVIPGSANGRIVVDVTVGQLRVFAQELAYFGLVPSPVTVEVRNGVLADVYGNAMADEFKARIFALPEDARTLVELGQGLSAMQPTGLIGVDESIIDTCHFGFGHHENGTHTDLVIRCPTIQVAED